MLGTAPRVHSLPQIGAPGRETERPGKDQTKRFLLAKPSGFGIEHIAACSMRRVHATQRKTNRRTSMNQHDQSRKFADKSATVANEAFEKGKAAAEQATQAMEQTCSVTAENIRAFNVKMINMAHANADAAFDFAHHIATAKTPSDLIELWTAHARKQFEMLSEQIKELTALGQKMAGESTEPLARSVNQVFKIAS
jgi:phasin